MKIKSIKDVKNLAGKKVLLRVDFNVPIEAGEVKDDYKIKMHLPTIEYLCRAGAKIIIITHLGRPKDESDKEFSTKPLADRLSRLIGQEVKFFPGLLGFGAGSAAGNLKDGEILFLENLRYQAEEEKNDMQFARELSRLGNVYVNDAFAVCHRKHASVSAIKKYLPAYAGFLLENEITSLYKILKPDKPLVVIMGGVKAETKVPLIFKLHRQAHRILLGGALANNFLKVRGYEIGKSLVDEIGLEFAREFKSDKLILPIDAVVGTKKDGGSAKVKSVNKVNKNDYIFDIGPKTIRLYAHLIKSANTIVWNGPLGYFEKDEFKHGTLMIGRVVATRSKGKAFGVVGGGETVDAIQMTKMGDYVDWISTGGGAMLSFLAGEKMPGLDGIVKL